MYIGLLVQNDESAGIVHRILTRNLRRGCTSNVKSSDVCRITLCQIVIYCTYVGNGNSVQMHNEEVNIWYMDPVHVVVDVKVTAD